MTQKEIGIEVGLSGSVLSQWLANKYGRSSRRSVSEDLVRSMGRETTRTSLAIDIKMRSWLEGLGCAPPLRAFLFFQQEAVVALEPVETDPDDRSSRGRQTDQSLEQRWIENFVELASLDIDPATTQDYASAMFHKMKAEILQQAGLEYGCQTDSERLCEECTAPHDGQYARCDSTNLCSGFTHFPLLSGSLSVTRDDFQWAFLWAQLFRCFWG